MNEDIEKLEDERLKFVYKFFIKNRGFVPEKYKRIGKYNPELLESFARFYKSVVSKGALSEKMKELIIIAIETATRGPNTTFHAKRAVSLGATPEEIHESLALAFLWAGMEAYVDHGAGVIENTEKYYKQKQEGTFTEEFEETQE